MKNTVHTLRVGKKIALRIVTDRNGNAALTSFIHPMPRESKQFAATTRSGVFDILTAHTDGIINRRLRNVIAKEIADDIVDPSDTAIDGIESFILALAAAGIDLSHPAFADALSTSLESIANNM